MNTQSDTDFFWRIVAAIALLAFGLVARADEPKSHERYALLVGVNEYQHDKLKALRFAENDVTALTVVLKAAKYHVTLLTTKSDTAELKPTKSNIEKQLGQILQKCHKSDTILIAFSGHGLQFEGEADAFFCPLDAKPFKTNTDTLVSIGKIYRELDSSFATMKVLLVDACRDDPAAGRGVSRGITSASAPPPPPGVAALFSCGAGEQAFESPKFKHGVFFYHVIEGLKGWAADSDQEVTFASLASYVSRRVRRDVSELVGDGATQSPNLKADYTVEPVLLSASRSRTDDDQLREDWSEFCRMQAKGNGNGVITGRASQRMAAWKLAADGGDARAQVLVGEFMRLKSPKQDGATAAAALFRKAADQGELAGMVSLGRCYATGFGVDKDATEAIKWYRRAGDRGFAEAQRYLGLRFELGQGVAKDGKEAVAWYERAASQNDMFAMYCLGRMFESGVDIAKDEAAAARWYRKAAELGHSLAQYKLAVMLENGQGVAKDAAEAARWYRRAAEVGGSLAQYKLAVMLENGQGATKDLAQAIEWYRRAAAHNSPDAKKALERLGVKP